MDKETVQKIRKQIQKALDAAKLGDYKVDVGSAQYGSSYVKFSVELSDIINGEVVTKEAGAFRKYAKSYDLEPSDLGRTFSFKGDEYKISGLRPSARRFPICAVRISDQKHYRFPHSTVRDGLGKSAQAVAA
jgi:hypothetical protein